MEIERKFLAGYLPPGYAGCERHEISQGYISTDPVIRIRRMDDEYFLTVKSGGLLAREEFEINISKEAFDKLSGKCEGIILSKTRYYIPQEGNLMAEMDVFHGDFDGLRYIEVEVGSVEEAEDFIPPDYFGPEVTDKPEYQNSGLSKMSPEDITEFIKENKLF